MLVWRLDEEAPQLLSLCRGAGIPVDDLVELPVKRQREKAVERLLLCHDLGHPVTMSHTPQGAPVVDGHDGLNISITHTRHLVALALNGNAVIGLDAEQVDREQVIKVRHKFLNASEQQFITADDQAAQKGDIVTVDYVELDKDGNEVAGTKRDGYVFTIGDADAYNISDDVVGMKKG